MKAKSEGLPLVKLMMLVSSMTPLFVLTGIRGLPVVSDHALWMVVAGLIVVPLSVVLLRIKSAVRTSDIFHIDVSQVQSNKEYLFTYLFTVLLPLYSISITDNREFAAILFAILFVIFVLWHMDLHFANIFFAFAGYKVFTIESHHSAVLLTTRSSFPKNAKEIKVHRLSNSVFIEIKNHDYGRS